MFKELLKIWQEDSLLNAAIETAKEMFRENNKLVKDSLDALMINQKFTLDVYKEDKKINHFEKDIRRKILEHLTINPQQDVAAALVLLGVARDIERIGDYTKNYFELNKLYQKPFSGPYATRLIAIKKQFIEYSFATQEVMSSGDSARAKEVIEWYYEGAATELDKIIKEVMADKLDVQDAVAYALLCRYIKRSAAHLANIASSVSNPFHKIGFGMKSGKEVEVRS